MPRRLGGADQLGHVDDVLPLHAFARLVEQKQRLGFGEAAHERQDLLLAARERAGVLAEALRQDREAREQRRERVEAAVGPHQREVVAHAQVVEHRPLLRAVAHAEGAPLRGFEALDGPAFEPHRAFAAGQLAEQHLHQRALADAVAADDREHLAGGDRAGDAAHDRDVAVAADQALEREPRAHFSAPT